MSFLWSILLRILSLMKVHPVIPLAFILLVTVIRIVRAIQKKRAANDRLSELARKKEMDEALNRALRNPEMEYKRNAGEKPVEVSYNDGQPGKSAGKKGMMAEITELHTFSKRKYIFSLQEPVMIGTAADNNLVLNVKDAGAHHCELFLHGSAPCAKTFGNSKTLLKRGRSSTYVDGEGVLLTDGDRLSIGEAVLEVRFFKA